MGKRKFGDILANIVFTIMAAFILFLSALITRHVTLFIPNFAWMLGQIIISAIIFLWGIIRLMTYIKINKVTKTNQKTDEPSN